MAKVLSVFSFCILICGIRSEIADKKSHLNFQGTHPIQINKVSLTQKGYIQFLRYLTDVPAIEDFTFCIWLKSSNFTYSHPLLSYSMHEADRFIRAWVTPHGEEIKLALREKEIFSVAVGLQEHHWYHICPSWSSKTGHWDLFMNGKLKAHGFREKARGIILPKHGDLVVGQEYTDFDKGLDDGIEGDIFGFNMVLSSVTPKRLSIIKAPLRFNRRRISQMERRMNEGVMVSSPTLMLRRKSRTTEESNINTKDNYIKLNRGTQNKNISFEDIVLDTDEIKIPTINFTPEKLFEEDNSESTISTLSEDSDYLSTNRNKRQSFSYTPMSYSNFNFGSKPSIFRPFQPTYFQQKIPSQYAIHHEYSLGPFMVPPRKTSRISNDIVPSLNQKPLGLQLIELSYNCVLGKGAPLTNVLVSWTKTPVRVFGGAILKKGDPFCLRTE